ncbi:MAG: hypothetical protein VB117_07390, partial [[Clostridium] scindens]|uniref:hypothetical protein n=1 Tax=Clostridium scindens (strain JCM 10418 / VPI 12708) TaxID=29347 RepID=UPI002B2046C6
RQKTSYLRVYRMSSDTVAAVTVTYLDAEGVLQTATAEFDSAARAYSGYIPQGVRVVDITVDGPSDLSYVRLIPGMSAPARRSHTVKGVDFTGNKLTLSVEVTAMDGTEAVYALHLYREDTVLETVTVDGGENLAPTDKTVVWYGAETPLYEGLADSAAAAMIYLRAHSDRVLVQAGQHGSVTVPDRNNSTNIWNNGALPYPLTLTDSANGTYQYTDVEILTKGAFGTNTAVLRVYQRNGNAELRHAAPITVRYTDDLGRADSAAVYRVGTTNAFEAALPSTARSAAVTAGAEHPLAAVLAKLAGDPFVPGDAYGTGSHTLALDLAALGTGGSIALHIRVISTDGLAAGEYSLTIRFVNVNLGKVSVDDTLALPGAAAVVPLQYAAVDGKLTRYYEQMVGHIDQPEELLELILNFNSEDYESGTQPTDAQVSVRDVTANGAWGSTGQPYWHADAFRMQGVELQTFLVEVENFVTLTGGQKVSYKAQSLVRVYHRSSVAGTDSVRLAYGAGLEQKAAERAPGVYQIYLPDDVETGDLIFTAKSAGARVSLSTGVIDVDNELSLKNLTLTRGSAVLKDLDLSGDAPTLVYAYVLPSNYAEPAKGVGAVYKVYVTRISLGLKTADVTAWNGNSGQY